MSLKNKITVLLTTSPIPSHPSTDIIEETIESVRHWLPDSVILILMDGVRPEQADRQEAYAEFLHRLTGLAIFRMRNIHIAPFMVHTHQAAMVRQALELVATPHLLFMEHDTPLVIDCEIPFAGFVEVLDGNFIQLIRLLHEAEIHPEHMHLMSYSLIDCGLPFTRTMQFSARPHLARKDFYERLLARFSKDANCFVEDLAHSICQENAEDWPMAIYTPEGNKKRSYHTDGRAGYRKFDELQRF
jgi:hypothetical protein